MENREYIHDKFFTWYKFFWFAVYSLMISGGCLYVELTSQVVYGQSVIATIIDLSLEHKAKKDK